MIVLLLLPMCCCFDFNANTCHGCEEESAKKRRNDRINCTVFDSNIILTEYETAIRPHYEA